MYLQEYHDAGLGSLKKRLKKVAKVAAHVGAAFATGGASLAVTAAMVNAKKQKAAQAAAAAQEQAAIAQMTAAASQPYIAPAVVTPSAGGTMPVTVAPATVAPKTGDYMQPGEAGGQSMTVDAPSNKPAWLMPALIGGGLLLLLRGGRR